MPVTPAQADAVCASGGEVSRGVGPVGCGVYLLPVRMRVPLKFGHQVLREVTCLRVRVTVRGADGRTATGWGETPLSAPWAWPGGGETLERRVARMVAFAQRLGAAWVDMGCRGHALEVGHAFLESRLPALLREANAGEAEAMPRLAALVVASAFDVALHDAYGHWARRPVYETYAPPYLTKDLGAFIDSPEDAGRFSGKYPADFLVRDAPPELVVWHLVGGLDPLEARELTGNEPDDGHPVLLRDWIARDGLTCLKIKLRGNDPAWDFDRLVRVGEIAQQTGVRWLSADFNCTVEDPAYVAEILDRLRDDHPRCFGMLLYVEQPFAYELEDHDIDVHDLAWRKPLLLDESAHDWRAVRLGRARGWNGVALKTCKTQTGALLSLCFAKAHGMAVMVQDLTNPMLAQIPHVQLAAHAGTFMGVESNAMQFYPDASAPEAAVHPGLYRRRGGVLDLSTLEGNGFCCRLDEINRALPAPACTFGEED